MDSFNDAAPVTNAKRTGEDNCFRRLLHCNLLLSEDFFAKHRALGQYYVASMQFIIITIYTFRFFNMMQCIHLAVFDNNFITPLVKDTTYKDRQAYLHGIRGAEICIQVPGALLIYITSSKKFLTATVAISSILHMLLPVAGDLYPGSLLLMIPLQILLEAPHRIAMLSMWIDWSTSGDRKKFAFLSLSSYFLLYPASLFIRYFDNLITLKYGFYISGACGLLWSLVWFYTVPDFPANNPQFLENEQLCVQNSVLPKLKETPKLADVPWKYILTSKPVFALCLLYFKIGGSLELMATMLFIYGLGLNDSYRFMFIYFHIIFAVLFFVILLSGALITDCLVKKFQRIRRNVRKDILITVLALHAVLLFGTLIHHIIPDVIFFSVSYFVYSISIAGIITNALDLSSRYVTLIAGFIETFFHLGKFISYFYIDYIYENLGKQEDMYVYGKFLLYDVAVTIFAVVFFVFWGSMEEQSWSLNTSTERRSENTDAHTRQEEHELVFVP